jgi:hypothetical protein
MSTEPIGFGLDKKKMLLIKQKFNGIKRRYIGLDNSFSILIIIIVKIIIIGMNKIEKFG